VTWGRIVLLATGPVAATLVAFGTTTP